MDVMTNDFKYQVSIITVGMNHLSYLKPYLKSLFDKYKPICSFELIYVDNCSTDDSVSYIRSNYPEVKIIENNQCLGFGENNNKGIAAAKGKYVAILNPDIELLDQSIDRILEFSEKLNQDAIVVPRLYNADGSSQYSVRHFMTLRIFISRLITKGNDESKNKNIKHYLFQDIKSEKTQYVDWAIGAAFFMKKDLFDKLKGFDEDYFLYFEDVDLCLRSWKNNYPVIYYPESKMIHNHLRASAKLGSKTIMHFKSLFTYFTKHGINVKSINKPY